MDSLIIQPRSPCIKIHTLLEAIILPFKVESSTNSRKCWKSRMMAKKQPFEEVGVDEEDFDSSQAQVS